MQLKDPFSLSVWDSHPIELGLALLGLALLPFQGFFSIYSHCVVSGTRDSCYSIAIPYPIFTSRIGRNYGRRRLLQSSGIDFPHLCQVRVEVVMSRKEKDDVIVHFTVFYIDPLCHVSD